LTEGCPARIVADLKQNSGEFFVADNFPIVVQRVDG
jgi:hypothetical protein